MSVPFIDLKRFEPGFLDAWAEKVARMSRDAQFIGGAEVAQLEQALSQDTGVAHAVSCANGTDALQLALRALGVGTGDRVLIPDLTFWATYEAVINVGAVPCTADISMDDMSIDVDIVAEALRKERFAAVVAVHLYGWGSARLDELRAACASAGVPLLEDGAQCYGTQRGERSIYAGCEIASISFYPAKVLGAAGDGGAVLCRDATVADKVRKLANHGRTTHYGHGLVGWNSRMDSLQAAYLNLSMRHLPARLESRRQWAARYQRELSLPGLRVISPPKGYRENGYCNVTLREDFQSKDLNKFLFENGVVADHLVTKKKSLEKMFLEILADADH